MKIRKSTRILFALIYHKDLNSRDKESSMILLSSYQPLRLASIAYDLALNLNKNAINK